MGVPWLPRYMRYANDPGRPARSRGFLRSKMGIVTVVWLLLIVAAIMTHPFAPERANQGNRQPVAADTASNNNPAAADKVAPNIPPVEPGAANNIPTEKAPIDDAPDDDTSTSNASADDASADDASYDDASYDDAFYDDTSYEDGPLDDAQAAPTGKQDDFPYEPPFLPAKSLLRFKRIAKKGNNWHGWDSIAYMFAFGDSWTTTKFGVNGAQPSEKNPLGNPPWPGESNLAGPGWVPFLTGWYNGTVMKTANLARGGATTDDQVLPPFRPVAKSFRQQLLDWWQPAYGGKESRLDWASDNSIFAMWMGLNDLIGIVSGKHDIPTMLPIVDAYARLIDDAYAAGARNFLFLNLPPHDRAPITTVRRHDEAAKIHHGAVFNNALDRMVKNLTDTYSDCTCFLFDAHTFYTRILDDPCSYDMTCSLRNVTGACSGYEQKHLTPDYYVPECEYPVRDYFWKDINHPTSTVLNATAKAIVDVLRAEA